MDEAKTDEAISHERVAKGVESLKLYVQELTNGKCYPHLIF
jgi:hypothetical protein